MKVSRLHDLDYRCELKPTELQIGEGYVIKA